MKPPKGWLLLRMGQLGDVKAGRQLNSDNTKGQPYPYLRVANVQDGWIDFDDVKSMSMTDSEYLNYRLFPGDILLAEGQSIDLVGRPAKYLGEIERCCFQNSLVRLRPRGHCPDFCYYLCSFLYQNGVFQRVAKQTTSMAHLGVDRFANVPALMPPFHEQQAIAAILSTWTDGLRWFDKLISAKERRKTALMQQLLSGMRRLRGFSGRWVDAPLGSSIAPNARIVPKPREAFLAAGIRSHGKGVFLKRLFKPEDIALEELFQIRTNDLVVNITFAWEGAVAVVPPEADGALVSHRFPTYRCIPGKTDVAFLRHLIRSKRFVFACGLASPGGAGRNRVLGKEAFLAIPIKLPPLREQEAIAAVLDTCDEELRLLRAQRAAVDQQKRGLMQRLLTGRIRVRV